MFLPVSFERESGYSLIEVVASIMILTIAILPMVGVFDFGPQGTMSSGNYDKARALANLKMEQAKSLSFDSTKNSFPVSPSAPDATTATMNIPVMTCLIVRLLRSPILFRRTLSTRSRSRL